MKNDSPTLPRIVLGILALSFLGTVFAINLHSQQQLSFLKKTAKQTEGFISAKHCNNHGSIRYTYRADDKEFSSSGLSCVKSFCEEAKIGDPVNVIYSSAKPQLSVCNDLSQSEGEVSQIYLILFIVSLAVSIAIYRITRKT